MEAGKAINRPLCLTLWLTYNCVYTLFALCLHLGLALSTRSCSGLYADQGSFTKSKGPCLLRLRA